MKILEAGLPHLDQVAPLFDAYRRFYGRPGDLEAARKFLEARILQHESVIYLAALDEQPVGFVQLYPTFSSVSMQAVWTLNDLFVAPEARGRSVATALLERARELAIETGAKGLALATAFDNQTAQALYERLGYRRDTDFYHYFLTV